MFSSDSPELDNIPFLVFIRETDVIPQLRDIVNKSLESDEPVPDIRDKWPLLYDVCCRIYGSFGGTCYYPSKEDKAVQLYFSIVTEHILLNGNKRMALIMLVIFCTVEGLPLLPDNDTLYTLSCEVASNKVESGEQLSDDALKQKIRRVLFGK